MRFLERLPTWVCCILIIAGVVTSQVVAALAVDALVDQLDIG